MGGKQEGNMSNAHVHSSDTGTHSTTTNASGSSASTSATHYITRKAHKSSYRVYLTTATIGRVVREG